MFRNFVVNGVWYLGRGDVWNLVCNGIGHLLTSDIRDFDFYLIWNLLFNGVRNFFRDCIGLECFNFKRLFLVDSLSPLVWDLDGFGVWNLRCNLVFLLDIVGDLIGMSIIG